MPLSSIVAGGVASIVPLLVLAIALSAAVASPARASSPGWVPFDEATIHPGVRTVTEGSQCTANFVFTDSGGDVYIGQAAHCAGGGSSTQTDGCTTPSEPLGTPVRVDGASRPGVLAYSSWLTMQQVGETDENACAFNDFALVRLDPADHGSVNPSLPFYGGPQGITPTTTAGESVYTFGNSSLRPDGGSPKSGTARGQTGDGWSHDVFTLNLGIPGDSGSAFLNSTGQAFGVLSTLEVLPNVGNNGVSDLTRMLDYLATHTDLQVTVAMGTLQFDPAGATVDTARGEEGAVGAQTRRLQGSSRVETAVAVSRDDFGDGRAGAVVLARSDEAADALAGTALAVAADGPLLLTPSDALHPAADAEIRRVLPAGGTVYLLGGEQALGPAVASALTGFDVRRIAGATRIETAIAVAEETAGSPSQVLLANGRTFADALVAGPAAASVGGVVVLTDGDQPHPAVDAYLARTASATVVTVGQAATTAYPGRTSHVGTSDQQTSVRVAEAYADGARTVGVARVDVFADALSGGAHIARSGGPLLLTDGDRLTPVVRDHLSARAATVDIAVLYGGTAAISAQVAEEIREAISAP